MILSRVLAHLATHGIASPGQIAHALGSSPDAVHSMLETLRRRGLIHRVGAGSACGSCGRCVQPTDEWYGYGPARPSDQAAAPCPNPPRR